MAVPLNQVLRVGAYVAKQHLIGNKRYPLVLMLEPLFRCNLACAGCGKIDYPDDILNQRLSVEECLQAVDECGAPVVSIAGGEPLLHKEIDKVVEGIIARKKFVYLCTNTLLLEKKLELFKPNPYFTWSVHLDGDREDHDKSVCQTGVYDRAVAAIGAAKAKGFRCNINCTLFDGADPERYAKTYRELMETTDWDAYGTGNYEKCADCMVHSGYEATAVNDAVRHPLKALVAQIKGPRTEGEMAPEIPLDQQRPAEYVFSSHVQQAMDRLKHQPKAAANDSDEYAASAE